MPPRSSASGDVSPGRETGPAALSCLATLKKRADFVAASRAKRVNQPGFVLQFRKRSDDEASDAGMRIGFTCSKKVGNAVARNRAKRRLREMARHVMPMAGRAGFDYVLVGRHGQTALIPFSDLCAQLEKALAIAHSGKQ